jgi:hypothetical protein
LLVEIRIAIQGVDSHCFPVHVCNLEDFIHNYHFLQEIWDLAKINRA